MNKELEALQKLRNLVEYLTRIDYVPTDLRNEAKELLDSKIRFTNSDWNYDAYNKRVYATKRLRLFGVLDTGIVAKITYNGKRFNIKIMETKGE